ncbi:MAG: hypothetical protein ABJG68_13540 [Crocinitomicaceae bacterium]
MRAWALFSLLTIVFINTSCEKCKRCTYTYEETTIEQGVNGEEEKVTTYSGSLIKEDGTSFSEECIKNDESFTIEQFYQAKKDTTVLENFTFVCEDF